MTSFGVCVCVLPLTTPCPKEPSQQLARLPPPSRAVRLRPGHGRRSRHRPARIRMGSPRLTRPPSRSGRQHRSPKNAGVVVWTSPNSSDTLRPCPTATPRFAPGQAQKRPHAARMIACPCSCAPLLPSPRGNSPGPRQVRANHAPRRAARHHVRIRTDPAGAPSRLPVRHARPRSSASLCTTGQAEAG